MPWSILPRLRRPRRPPELPLPEQVPSPQQLQIDRKILQDPSSLLDSQVQDALPFGLTPSTRLPSASGSSNLNTRNRSKLTDATSKPLSQRNGLSSGSPQAQSRSAISRISNNTATGGEWSTFGRKRERRLPGVPDSPERTSPPDNLKGTPRSTQHSKYLSTPSTFTLGRLTSPSRTSTGTHEGPSSARSSQQSPDFRLSSKRSSSTNTVSSKRHPQTPQRPSSYTAPATSSATNSMTSVHRELAFDSPHTFGHPTPPDNPVDFRVSHPSPPPPLPPLDHPELTAVLSLRSKSTSTGQPTLSAFRDRSNTLPTRRRTPHKDDLFPSLSLKLGRSVRHPPEQVFNTTMAERQGSRPPDGRRRAVSAGARQRRTSADWSSYQATVGVNSHANQAWPAEVSREILRLSLPGPNQVPGSSQKRNTSTRGRNTDPIRRSHRGSLSPSILPFPHPSRPHSPPPLTASATRTDGRQIILPRSHSLQFNRRDNEQPAGHTMVKRNLSAIESRRSPNVRAGGATHTSLGLSAPVLTSSDAPRASLARTPSRSLFSGSLFPTNAAMSSSSVQGDPSTPTPEPRHPSDKSRGKRKAEDNIDLTPPEQKKEGQRATFLLPSGSRSQRVSNSSHAPSSYHRKRARLSSTSPFATPVQSRPASVQETPPSASRNHYFASLSSSTGARVAPRTPSHAASTRSHQPPTPSTTRKHERPMSQVSIPISAYISPHAPSVSTSTKFHMRDPRKPPKKPNDTPWGLRFATEDEPGSPIQAWCFFFGFLVFPVWWIAGLFLRVPTTRIAGDLDAEKGVTIDDPQIEHDARIWRFRCRVMAVVSLFTYVPFIVLITIFVPR